MSDTISIILPKGWRISSRLMLCWQIDDEHTLEIAPAGRTEEQRIRWSYRLAKGEEEIFAAADVCSPVGVAFDTEQLISAARSVLGFLTLRPGDTDASDFEAYTPEQLAWCEADAEELSLLAMDDQCGYCGSEDHLSPGCPGL